MNIAPLQNINGWGSTQRFLSYQFNFKTLFSDRN